MTECQRLSLTANRLGSNKMSSPNLVGGYYKERFKGYGNFLGGRSADEGLQNAKDCP